jgi:putative nucleotidyltransferase with HDIG domain
MSTNIMSGPATLGVPKLRSGRNLKQALAEQLASANKELWLVLSLLLLAAFLNVVVDGQRMVLGFYTLPTLYSAYVYGRRHAVLTAFASAFLVGLVTYINPPLFTHQRWILPTAIDDKWFDLTIWAGILVMTAYTMGTLYEHRNAHLKELRSTYHGILMILQQFISKDKYTQNHSYRVSVYATKIAHEMRLDNERVEDVHAAALLHDIGKLDISRELLYKAARLTEQESAAMQTHVDKGLHMLAPVGGSLRRVLPIILSHHDKYDGSGYHPTAGEQIPLEARILSVADVYDSLTSDRPYRKAMSPFDAKEIIAKGSGAEFDPAVVEAFLRAFNRREMEVPEVVV